MRISDWSSDVCSSDLPVGQATTAANWTEGHDGPCEIVDFGFDIFMSAGLANNIFRADERDDGLFPIRKGGRRTCTKLRPELGEEVDEEIGRASWRGKSVSVRVDIGGGRNNKKK